MKPVDTTVLDGPAVRVARSPAGRQDIVIGRIAQAIYDADEAMTAETSAAYGVDLGRRESWSEATLRAPSLREDYERRARAVLAALAGLGVHPVAPPA